ncbi:hypothetical protein AGOR_G00212190 [Albula goreensis]|uniref:Uncharacterized protein n=1 Tax=Albula goreensis TaxID=1534307 RepID=A0A8T3CMF1_9TELE|nr:hypothetical protein AGOR_G00212190 [Albula goreensis]
MALKILFLFACSLVTFAEQDQGDPEQTHHPGVTLYKASTTAGSIAVPSAMTRPSEDKSKVRNPGLGKVVCYCNGRKRRVLSQGCPCKKTGKYPRGKTPKTKTIKGWKPHSHPPISTPI